MLTGEVCGYRNGQEEGGANAVICLGICSFHEKSSRLRISAPKCFWGGSLTKETFIKEIWFTYVSTMKPWLRN